jgi:tetratricopeptide (TPR) repeat protein
MAQPALKLNEYGEKLGNFSGALSELEIRRMIAELQRMTQMLSGPDLAGAYSLMGMAQYRLGKHDRALVEFKKSVRMHPIRKHRWNLAKLELELGLVNEAVDVLAELVEADGRDAQGLAQFAEALFRLGSVQDAREIFEQAISVADFTNPTDVIVLAVQAAKIGADAEGVELYARALALLAGVALGDEPAVTVIERASAAGRHINLTHASALALAIERAIHFGPGVEQLRMMPLPAQPPISGPADADETAEDVLAWMGPHRARANAAVLPEGDEDE